MDILSRQFIDALRTEHPKLMARVEEMEKRIDMIELALADDAQPGKRSRGPGRPRKIAAE